VLPHPVRERNRKVAVHVEARDAREVVQFERRRVRPVEHVDELLAADRWDELSRGGIGAHGDRAAGGDDDDRHRAAA
jgi:hypothetical protein